MSGESEIENHFITTGHASARNKTNPPMPKAPPKFDVEAFAEAQDLQVVYRQRKQVQLDIDSDLQYVIFQKRFIELQKFFDDVAEIEEHVSKRGLPHRHITITWYKDLTDHEAIIQQFILGSDPIRETLNYYRGLWGDPSPIRLFEVEENGK